MSKPRPTLMWIFFLLSIMFLGLMIILGGYFINDYIAINNSDTVSGIEYLMFGSLYFIGFLPISFLGLIFSVLTTIYATSKKIQIFSVAEIIIFAVGIISPFFLYYG